MQVTYIQKFTKEHINHLNKTTLLLTVVQIPSKRLQHQLIEEHNLSDDTEIKFDFNGKFTDDGYYTGFYTFKW